MSNSTYRKTKSLGRLSEITYNDEKWVVADSLSTMTYKKASSILSEVDSKYRILLKNMDSAGLDCTRTAVEFTAETLAINEPFIKSSIIKYMNAHYGNYITAYMELGLNSNSVKGYAKQCALIEWIYDFAMDLRSKEPDAKKSTLLLRSFRANLLTVLSEIELETKIPLSESRFNLWFDKVILNMEKGQNPDQVITVKRIKNKNREKFTEEQKQIAICFYTQGNGMPVEQVYQRLLEMGRQKGWWIDAEGEYKPICRSRLYQILQPLKNPLTMMREDSVKHYLNVTNHFTRLSDQEK